MITEGFKTSSLTFSKSSLECASTMRHFEEMPPLITTAEACPHQPPAFALKIQCNSLLVQSSHCSSQTWRSSLFPESHMVRIVSYHKVLGPHSYLSIVSIHRWAYIPQRIFYFSSHYVVNSSVRYAGIFCDQIITLQSSVNHDQLPRRSNSLSLQCQTISQGLHWPFPLNHLDQGDLIHPNTSFSMKLYTGRWNYEALAL